MGPSLFSKPISRVKSVMARSHNSADRYLGSVIAFGFSRWTELMDTVDTVQVFQTGPGMFLYSMLILDRHMQEDINNFLNVAISCVTKLTSDPI